MAADVARDGFNVTHDFGESLYSFTNTVTDDYDCFVTSLCYSHFCNLLAAEALAKVKDQNISQAFRELFLPDGQVPLSGLFTRRLDLAAILYRIAIDGISEFYNGNLTQEIVTEVSSFCKYQHVH